MRKVVYISGPMSGIRGLNYRAFHIAARSLIDAGYAVVNPAENDPRVPDPEWEDFMAISRRQVASADAVVLLFGWSGSRGAREEVAIARANGIPVYNWGALS